MASDINVVCLVGRLTKPAELRYTQGGQAFLSFTVAVNTASRDGNGNWTDVGNFFDCTYYSQSAQNISQYLEKGRQVSIEGSLAQRRWQDQNGNNRSAVGIRVRALELLGGEKKEGQTAQATAPKPQPNTQAAPPVGPEGFDDDSIPF